MAIGLALLALLGRGVVCGARPAVENIKQVVHGGCNCVCAFVCVLFVRVFACVYMHVVLC